MTGKKRGKMMSDRDKRGSILIAVLWSLFFLAALAMVINISITPQLGLAAKLKDRATLHYLAKAGIKVAITEIRKDETKDFDALNESWSSNELVFKEIEIADGEYFTLEYPVSVAEDADQEEKRYGLIDEERKVNINVLPADVLKQFFETVGGTSSQDATDIADAIIDWRDEDDEPSDNGAESSYYEGLEEGYPCKNAEFEVLEELRLVKGVTQDIFDTVKDRITVYGAGLVNINTADMLVLQSLGMSEELAENIVLFRQGGDGQEATEDDNAFEDSGAVTATLSAGRSMSPEQREELDAVVEAGLITVRSDNFRGQVIGGFADRNVLVNIIFVVNRLEQIRYWQES